MGNCLACFKSTDGRSNSSSSCKYQAASTDIPGESISPGSYGKDPEDTNYNNNYPLAYPQTTILVEHRHQLLDNRDVRDQSGESYILCLLLLAQQDSNFGLLSLLLSTCEHHLSYIHLCNIK